MKSCLLCYIAVMAGNRLPLPKEIRVEHCKETRVTVEQHSGAQEISKKLPDNACIIERNHRHAGDTVGMEKQHALKPTFVDVYQECKRIPLPRSRIRITTCIPPVDLIHLMQYIMFYKKLVKEIDNRTCQLFDSYKRAFEAKIGIVYIMPVLPMMLFAFNRTKLKRIWDNIPVDEKVKLYDWYERNQQLCDKGARSCDIKITVIM